MRGARREARRAALERGAALRAVRGRGGVLAPRAGKVDAARLAFVLQEEHDVVGRVLLRMRGEAELRKVGHDLADGAAKDDRPAAEEDRTVKLGEDAPTGLVNGGDDGHARSQLLQQPHDVEGHLRVEAGRGFVDEEHARRYEQLQPDGHALALAA